MAPLVLVVLLGASFGFGQGIAFTVQVIAVSDQANALDISRTLLRDGFPAYVVRSTGGQGDVYRVRVGAFGNRAAAARYAAAMPDVGGARPVPALAEAIPAGIMPVAPRIVWQSPAAGADLRVLAWPGGGLALRRQPNDPLRQATYDLIQGGEVRTVQAWRVAPLAALPPSLDLIEVPFIDMTVGAAAAEGAAAAPPLDGAPALDGAPPLDGAPEPEAAAAEDAAPAPAAATPPSADATAPARAEGPAWADPSGSEPEVGLLLLRDRSLWPPTWAEDRDEVRSAFRDATLTLVANRVGLGVAEVEGHAYFPTGGPPPALVVVEVSDRSGRDLGEVRGLGDPRAGLRPEGPPPTAGVDPLWWPVGGIGDRVRLDAPADDAPIGGDAWRLSADGGFVRIETADGAAWRAVAGVPLWSDGRYALVRDGADVVLVDFLPR